MNPPSDQPTVQSENPEPRGAFTVNIGEYVLLDNGQEGGMGVVYRARHRKLDRVVALKMIRGRLATKLQLERFRAEAEAAATLDHPHIVPIYEVGEHEGQPYLVMKWIDGHSLSEAISELSAGQPTANQTVARMMSKIAQALHHAHQRGIIHRDLKPGNVLVDKAGEPFVADFGLAKRLESNVEITAAGAVLGTPSYMSPEQAAGATKELTVASDVYGLGAILYCLLTGRAPFEGANAFEVLAQVMEKEPPRPTSIRPGIDSDLETICLKCLEKSVAHRYASAASLTEDLQHWLDGKPIAARPVSDWERAWKWMRRHSVVSSLVAAVGLSVVAGLIGVTWQWQRAERQSNLTRAANARLELQRAEDLFTADKSHLALATLARVLRETPTNRAAAERLLNALDQRTFFLPAPTLATQSSSSARTEHGPLVLGLVGSDSFQISNRVSGERIVPVRPAHSAPIRCAQFSLDGGRVVTASADGTTKVWNAQTGAQLLEIRHRHSVYWAEFSPDGKRIVTATSWPDAAARIWNATTGNPWEESAVMHHLNSVNTARFLETNLFTTRRELILTGSDDQTARLWDAHTGLPVSEAARPSKKVEDARLDATSILLLAEDGTSRNYQLTHGTRLVSGAEGESPQPVDDSVLGSVLLSLKKQLAGKQSGEITRLVFSPSGELVASGSTDKFARLWDRRTLQLRAELAHDATVNCVAFSPDGKRLATSTASPTQVRVWDVATGQPLSEWIQPGPDGPVAAVKFSADGTFLIASSGWKWRLHPVSAPTPAWLFDLAEGIAGFRYDNHGIPQPIGPEEFGKIKVKVLNSPPGDLADWARELIGNEQGK